MSMRYHYAPRGDAHYAAKLTEADVRLIRDAIVERARLLKAARQLSNELLGDKFGVGRRTIEKIATRETWGHL